MHIFALNNQLLIENNIQDIRGINPKGLILLWAFAESGIGGILHALKLPFTGIFVGGIAVMAIALLAYYTENRKTILQALGIVLLVKLAVSPHSPWQAYVAVIFQGYFGYLVFNSRKYFKLKSFIFSLICLLESAIQKILMALLIYGQKMMEAVDAAALSVLKSFGLQADTSLVSIVFGTYITLHLVVGIVLGIWIPAIPEQIKSLRVTLPENSNLTYSQSKSKGWKAIIGGFVILAALLLTIKLLVPSMKISDITFIFLRSLLISLGLIFIIGPFLKMIILRITKKQISGDQKMLKDVMESIPKFASRASSLLQWVNKEYSGMARIKNFILGLLWISLKYNDD